MDTEEITARASSFPAFDWRHDIFRYHDKISNFILMEPWLLPMTQVINIVTGLQFEQPVQAQESQGLETSLWDSMWGDWWL